MRSLCLPLRGAAGVTVLLLAILTSTAVAQEDALSKYKKSMAEDLPELAEQALDHLLKAVSDSGMAVDPAKMRPLLAFVADHAVDPEDLSMKKRYSSKGVCRQFELPAPLARVLRYHFNPDIPGQLVLPTAVRQTAWLIGSDILGPARPLWERLDEAAGRLLVLRGREHEVNAPNGDSGVWYAYDMDRLLVLLAFRGRPALVSVSLQLEDSSVGRKTVSLDNDQWLYFYSGKSGLNRSGIGWADTYVYRAASVNVFLEKEDGLVTDMAHFKWLDAGWKGLNVVGRNDLLDGSAAFVQAFIASFTSLPEPERLEEIGRWAAGLSQADVDRLGRAYGRDFAAVAEDDEAMNEDDFLEEIRDGDYPLGLGQGGVRALLALERLKCELGRPALGGVCQEP